MTDVPANVVVRKTAANGARIVAERIPGVRSVAVGVWFAGGVVEEAPALNGISHFLEHMSFKGTARRSAARISEEVEGVGGSLDGFTDCEAVGFFIRILDTHLPLACDVLADISLQSTVSEEDVAKERNVVCEEIRLYEDTPDDKVHDLIMAALEPARPLGMPVLGTRETVGRITREDVRAFRQRVFTADRMIIAGAGYLDPDDFIARAEEYFAAAPAAAAEGPPPFEPRAPLFAVPKDTEQTHLCVAVPGLPFDHPDRYVYSALATMLGGNTSSRLFRQVREERGLAYAVYAYGRTHRDSGALVAYAGTTPGTAELTRDLILEQFHTLATTPAPEEEVARTREYLKGNFMLALESTSARATRNARHELYLGRYVSLEETLAGVDAVTAADIQRVAARLFAVKPTVVAIGPNAEAVVNH